jgi:hypothetical protein
VGLACFVVGVAVLPWFEAAGREATLADIRTTFTVAETDPDDVLPGPAEPAGAARVAAAAVDSGKARYLELYTDTLWTAAIAAAALAVVFSTVLTPRSTVGALMLGVRSLASLAVVLAGAAHGAALWVVFSGTGGPSPAFGVWLGVGGLAGVFLACLLGPRR